MAKKHVGNEVLEIYTDSSLVPKPRKTIKFEDGSFGYIGLTQDLSSPLASKKRVKINDIVYAEMLRIDKSQLITILSVTRDETNPDPSLTFKESILGSEDIKVLSVTRDETNSDPSLIYSEVVL